MLRRSSAGDADTGGYDGEVFLLYQGDLTRTFGTTAEAIPCESAGGVEFYLFKQHHRRRTCGPDAYPFNPASLRQAVEQRL